MGGVAGEEVVAQGEGSVIAPFERDPRERGLKDEAAARRGTESGCALGSQGLLGGVSASQAGRGWRRGRAAMWIGESGGQGEGAGVAGPSGLGRRGQPHPRQGARRGSHLNPGEPVSDRGAGREGKESRECSAEKEPLVYPLLGLSFPD